MQISFRLKYLVDIIDNKNFILADIGTDHGYLPIYAINSQKAQFAYAVDLNPEPLEMAKKNILKANLTKQVQTVLSDGLKFSFENEIKKIDYVTISGLGTKTILQILNDDNNKIDNYAICSNTEIHQLRQWAKLNNYFIVFESFIFDFKKPYWVIIINKYKNFIMPDSLMFGDHKYFIDNQSYVVFLNNEIKKYQKIINKIKNNPKRILEFETKILEIERYLKKWN